MMENWQGARDEREELKQPSKIIHKISQKQTELITYLDHHANGFISVKQALIKERTGAIKVA